MSKNLLVKWFRRECAEGISTRGAEGAKGEEGALSGGTPAEGDAEHAKENTGAARAGEGRVHTQWTTSGTEEMWDRPERSW